MFNKVSYDNDYNRNNYDRFNIMLPKGAKEVIKQKCLKEGLSINAYISGLVLWDLGAEKWEDILQGVE